MEPLTIVVATDRQGCIGKDGSVPWKCPADLDHFRATTTGHAIIMGRTTYDSIGCPLPNRRNIVLTRNPQWSAEGVETADSLETAIKMARTSDACPIVIGGGQIYAQALPLATQAVITRVGVTVEGGDTWFPELSKAWVLLGDRHIEGAVIQVYERL